MVKTHINVIMTETGQQSLEVIMAKTCHQNKDCYKNLHQILDDHNSLLYRPSNQSESQSHGLSVGTRFGRNQGATG